MLDKLLPNEGLKAYLILSVTYISPVVIYFFAKNFITPKVDYLDSHVITDPIPLDVKIYMAVIVFAIFVWPLYKYTRGQPLVYSQQVMIRSIIFAAIIDGLILNAMVFS